MASPSDVLYSAYLGLCQEFAAAQAQAQSDGPMPSFSVDGVSMSWPDWRTFMVHQIGEAQDRYLKALEIDAITDPFEVRSDLGG